VLVSNVGNSPLTFAALSYPIDFPERLTATGLCRTPVPLAAGASCTLTVDFSPAAVLPSGTTQTLSENVSVTSNTLNGSATVQDVAVSGTETGTGTGRETAPPLFNPPAGSYAVGQKVTLTDATPGSAIYYTTNGIPPTHSSTRYTAPITLGAAETIQAIGVSVDLIDSPMTAAAYGVLPGAVTPVFSPAPGTYGSTQSVKISDATGGTTIYYTTNGTTPTTSSTKYTGAISVSSTETLEAIAVASGHSPSAAAIATYTIEASTPVFSLAAGTYSTTQSVKISDSIAGATIYYTTNGNTPTTSSTKYTGAISVNKTETIEAIAVATGHAPSPVASVTYTFQAAKPALSPAPGTYSTKQTVTISDGTPGATIYYTTNGNTPTTSSTKYKAGITVSSTETIQAIAVLSGYSQSAVASGTYTISPRAATPTFSPAPGTYSNAQSVKIADATSGATIYYTTNGNTPTTSSTKYTAAIPVSSTQTIQAIAVASGHTQSAVAKGTYTIVTPAATPAFSPAPGTYSTKQSVKITDATSGATIYYTTDGKAPTTSSTKYSAAITVKSTETIKAIAVASAHSQSAEASGKYTIK
jgi:hypothetical protein